MKNNLYFTMLALLCFMLGYQGNIQAYDRYDNCCPADECCQPAYDCGDPLNCGSLNFMLRVGAAPTVWRDRGSFSAVSCNALAIPGFNQSIVDIFQLPRFGKFFRVPWIIGGQIGYALTNNFEVYLEANYRSAKPREFTLSNVIIPNDTVNIRLTFANHYRAFDAYIGARYYWGRCWCEQVAFFLGAKFGLVSYKPVCFQYAVSSIACPAATPLSSSANTPFFLRHTAPGAGLNFGFDWCLGCGWSVMLIAEVVGSCGPSSNSNIVAGNACPVSMLPGILPNNLIVGSIGKELFFPITIGLKYSF